ncbi:unnamed protein product [Effrenium voratum]|uniref:Uncharacterized protein n=1 Tax=Effrenium voratum TaxID=2562239 RepID=A0AA36J6Y7_9DINO|nr:unnamed protein product [Effrenium voratum]CAJ1433703.1 unnamed protein product [Effrenium voratum]
MPFYIADDTFAGSLLDMRQLVWPWSALRPVPGTLGRASFHVHRWMAPFLAWYPLLFAFRRNIYDLADKLLEPTKTSRSSALVEAACMDQLPREVKTFLVALLGLYFRLVLSFFRVGSGSLCAAGGGVHLLLTPNASVILDTDGAWAPKVRPAPGNQGLSCPGLKGAGVAPWRRRSHPSPGQNLLQVSRGSSAWYRPVFDLIWHAAIVKKEFPPDGLSEHVALASKIQPRHFAAEGWLEAKRWGRFEEEIQTAWCSELSDSSWPWSVASGFQRHCAFPASAFCSRWVSSLTYSQLVALTSNESSQQHVFELLDWCGVSSLNRDLRAQQICSPEPEEEKLRLVCRIRRAARELLPSTAVSPLPSARERLWQELPKHRAL